MSNNNPQSKKENPKPTPPAPKPSVSHAAKIKTPLPPKSKTTPITPPATSPAPIKAAPPSTSSRQSEPAKPIPTSSADSSSDTKIMKNKSTDKIIQPAENKSPEAPKKEKIAEIPTPIVEEKTENKPTPEISAESKKDVPATEPQIPIKDKAEVKRPIPSPVPEPKVTKIKEKLSPLSFKEQLLINLGLANQKRIENKKKNLEIIMKYAIEKQHITNDEVEKLTGVKDAQATKYLAQLVKNHKLIKFGKTKNTFYKPIIK